VYDSAHILSDLKKNDVCGSRYGICKFGGFLIRNISEKKKE